jgi:hypothetical protein
MKPHREPSVAEVEEFMEILRTTPPHIYCTEEFARHILKEAAAEESR